MSKEKKDEETKDRQKSEGKKYEERLGDEAEIDDEKIGDEVEIDDEKQDKSSGALIIDETPQPMPIIRYY